MRKAIRGVPVWMIAVALISLILIAAAAYVFTTIKITVRVEEPLSVFAYPSLLSTYPNMTVSFDVTVNNTVSVNYLVSLAFSLNDTGYQQAYAAFSNETYTVFPGLNNLTAWVYFAADAPAATLELTVELSRVSELQSTFGYTFMWANETQALVNGTLALRMNFTHVQDGMSIVAQINDTYAENSSIFGMVFDKDFDGFNSSDGGYLLRADNKSWAGDGIGIIQRGEVMYGPMMGPFPYTYHNATFDRDSGWTYRILIPKGELPDKTGYRLERGLKVHISFCAKTWRPTMGGYSVVFVEFLYEAWGTNEWSW